MKIDFKKQIAAYTAGHGQFDVITVPTLQYLMIDGHGDPNTSIAYKNALNTIFPVAYKLKFFSKNELDRDYTVMPLEALWWASNMDSFTSARDKSEWNWTAMIMTPDWLSTEHFESAREAVRGKGGAPALEEIRLENLDKGLAVQTLHIGTYDDETPVLEEMHHSVIPSRSLKKVGKHHEIYLSDSRRTAPEKLKTILRQPVARV